MRRTQATALCLFALLTAPLAGCLEKDLTGLVVEDLVVGGGEEARSGRWVRASYTGWLADGTEFDSGLTGFELGEGDVIKGWDYGLEGMRVGGTRRLTVPPRLAYGERGAGDGVVPPNATLTFVVKLNKVYD